MKYVRVILLLAVSMLAVIFSSAVVTADEDDPTAKSATVVIGGHQPVPRVPKDALFEGFESGVVPPAGWTLLQTNPNETWQLHDFDPHSGLYAAEVLYDAALLDQDEVLLSPPFTADTGSVDFWSFGSLYWCRDTYDNCDLEVWLVKGNWGGGDDILLGLADDDWISTWEWSNSTFDFSAYADGSPARIAFRYIGNDGAQVALDDITINYSTTTCNDLHEPNDSRAEATPINYGDTLSADICPAGDVDYYVFSGGAGDVIVVDIDAQSLSPASALDSYLYLLDSYGNELTHNDDYGGLDSRIEYTLPADGTYYLKVEEYNHPNEGGPDYFYTISLVLAPPPFDVHSNYTASPPTIDGHISAGEWSDAASYDITALAALVRLEGGDVNLAIVGSGQQPRPKSPSSPVTLYVMNDGSHLYLAFDNPNDTVYHDFDQVGIYFDDNPLPSDGRWTNTTCGHADGEGNFWVLNSTPEFREIIAGPNYCDPVEPAPGVDGSLQFISGHAQAEVAIDLTNSALRASPGDSINMRLWIYDYDTGVMDGVWPIGSVWNDPSTYRPLTLATGGDVGPVVYDSHTVDDDTNGQSNGNGDGIVNCGETIELYVDLYNQGSDTATGVNAIISTGDPYVTWLYNTTSGYPDIPGGGTGTNTDDFDFEVDPSTPNGHIIHFDLDINADQGSWTDSFALPVACIGQASWTFLVYLDGDNNLEEAAIDDFLEMASVGSDSNVNIVVQLDRIPGYDSSYGDWTSTKRYRITPGMTPTPGNALQDIGEANMGDPQTLIDFVQWGMSNYPADHYAVIIWDHGSGWRLRPEEKPLIKDIAYDDTSGGDALNMPELRNAMDILSDGGLDPLDLVGFDACLMGMIEVDDQLIPFVEVRVGSEETEPWDGWPYDGILSALTANPTMSASQLGTIIVDEYHASYGNGETQSAVDLGTAYSDLVGAVSNFATALINGVPTYCSEMAIARSRTQMFYYTTYVDLYDFAYQINQQVSDVTINTAATAVMNSVNNAVIQEQHGSSWPGAHGVSIYFPEFEGGYDTTYDGSQGWLQFTANTQWDEWLHAFYDCPTTCNDLHEPNDSRAEATPINYGDTLSADICPAGDVDYYVFSGGAGDVIVVDIDAQSLSPASALDSYLYLLDSYGNELTHNDDYGGLDSRIEYTLPADGTYYLKVEEYNHPNEGGPDYFYTISLVLAPPPFDVHSNYTASPPTIDGHISAGEWSDAASYDITALAALVRLEGGDVNLAIVGSGQQPRPKSPSSPVTLYVMNDGSHLYLAFDNPNDTVYHDFDQVGIYFDDNPLPSDGRWTNTTCGHADGEGNFWVLNSTPEFREIIAGPNYCDPVEPAPGVDGSLQFISGHAQAEVAIDLTNSALRASPGDSINMRLWIYDYDTGVMDGVWPIGSVWNDPSTYRPLTLATGGGNVTVRIEPATSSVSPGDDFTINVMIDDVVDLGAYEFHMDFDPSIVHVVSVEDGGFLGSTGLTVIPLGPDIDNVAGTVAFGAITMGSGQGPGGTGALATVSLNAVGSGSSDLDLYDVSVLNTAGDPQTVVAQDGTVVVSGGGDAVIVTIEDGNGSPGSTDNPVTISADNQSQNPTPIAAGEFWVVYDGSIGLTLANVNTTARSTDFSVGWSLDETDPSAVEAHILLYSLSGATIASGTGPILELFFDLDAAAQAGDSSPLYFSGVALADQQGYEIPVDFTDTGQFTVGCTKDGDINDDGSTNVFDLQILVTMILHSPQPDPSLYPSDWWCRGDLAPPPNGDEQWNIFDLQRLVCIILGTCENGRDEGMQSRGENVISIEEVYAEPGTGGAFDIDCDNADAISAVEMWFTYDSTIGLDVNNVATTSQTDGWNVGFSKDESNPSVVEVHILLYNMSGWTIEPGTDAILSVEYDVDVGTSGDSPLHITQVNLSDALGQPLRAKSQDGMFHITEPYELYLPLITKNSSP